MGRLGDMLLSRPLTARVWPPKNIMGVRESSRGLNPSSLHTLMDLS